MKTKLLPLLGIGLLVSGVVGCDQKREPVKFDVGNAQVQGHYDHTTGKLKTITYDSNKNGKTDTWAYMDGARVVRIEIDKDEDGKLDRWEYYNSDDKLEKVGYSRANNGVADTWAYQGKDGKLEKIEMAPIPSIGENAVVQANLTKPGEADLSKEPKPTIVRTEFYENGVLVRAEEDTNGDGKIDKWDTYNGDGTMATAAFDTKTTGKADRRLVYGPNGAVTVEVDADGSGNWAPQTAAKKK